MTVFLAASSAVRDHMTEINERIKKERLRVCIFPEGTRNRTDGKMLPFKKGTLFGHMTEVFNNLAIDNRLP